MPFVIDGAVSYCSLQIHEAMEEIMEKSCIKFENRTTETAYVVVVYRSNIVENFMCKNFEQKKKLTRFPQDT